MGELLGAEHDQEQSGEEIARVGWGVRAIRHDILTANNERDYQALGMFLLPAVWEFVACEVAAIEIQPNDNVALHLYQACPGGIDLFSD